MKCINKYSKLVICVALSALCLLGCAKKGEAVVTPYESENYNKSLYKGEFFAKDLCVTSENVSLTDYDGDRSLHAAGLFDLEDKEVLYAYDVHEKLFPASTTKILTALLALKHGDLSDAVTVSEHAVDLEIDSSNCGLKAGDRLTLKDLLYGLLLQSGNDSATAIAEHISGSEEEFVKLMNEEAKSLGATNSHFANPHGLHVEDHYTTAYDLYLIFNECIKDEEFLSIIGASDYTASIVHKDGKTEDVQWKPTNFYAEGTVKAPDNVTMLGGKTGTTTEAGNCLIFFVKDLQSKPYVSIVMGASTKPILYQDMTALISAIPEDSE